MKNSSICHLENKPVFIENFIETLISFHVKIINGQLACFSCFYHLWLLDFCFEKLCNIVPLSAYFLFILKKENVFCIFLMLVREVVGYTLWLLIH